MADLKFLTYGAVIKYHRKSINPNTNAPKIFDAIVISEITTRREEDCVNVILVGKTSTSRFDVRLGTDRYARCGYGFAKITMGQITEIVDIMPRYEAEELHVRVLRAALGEVSENKADELFSKAMMGYIAQVCEPFTKTNSTELLEEPVTPVDLDKTTDPLVLQSLTVPMVPEKPEPIDVPVINENVETPISSKIDEEKKTMIPADRVSDVTKFTDALNTALSIAESRNDITVDDYLESLDELAYEFGYKSFRAALNNITKMTMTASARRKYNLAKQRYVSAKSHIKYMENKASTVTADASVTIPEVIEAAPVAPVVDNVDKTSYQDVATEIFNGSKSITPYEVAKMNFRKTCKAKNLDLVSGIGEVRAMLNDLYHAPDLSEFSRLYKYKRNREKLITKIKSLCFSHGLTFETEISRINEDRAKRGLDAIIDI